MKKFTGIVIIMALVLMQNVDQTEGFAPGGCNVPIHSGSGGIANGNNRPRGHSFEVNVGQQKRDGSHWNVKYTNNRDEHSINVNAGQQKPNGGHWNVDYTHDMKENK
ncbi:hypothetical protein ABFA07_008566 [Porites harrisoni]